MLDLSIVVPVYNVASFLEKCLESLLSQDISKDRYEIIIINDGSTDESGSIAEKYASKYRNVIVLSQANRGLSIARNVGIGLARGEYVQFVDSDDYLEPNILGALLSAAKTADLDVLRFGYQNVNEDYEVFCPNKKKPDLSSSDGIITDGETFLNSIMDCSCYAVQFMIRASILKKESNLFVPGILMEDTEWMPRVMMQARKIMTKDIIAYNYYQRQDSICQNSDIEHQRRILDNKIVVINRLLNQYSGNQNIRWYRVMISFVADKTLFQLYTTFFDEMDKYLSVLKKELNVFPLSLRRTCFRQKIRYLLINISPGLFCIVMHRLWLRKV